MRVSSAPPSFRMSTSDYRTAGIFLLLTALATAISVPARLAADADATPLTDALAQSQTLAAAEIARLEMSEKLAAIGGASNAYGVGGAARLVGGVTLLVAAVYLWRAMRMYHPAAMGIAALLLAASGIASAVSGASAVALASTGIGTAGYCRADPRSRLRQWNRRGPVRHPLAHRLAGLHPRRAWPLSR